MTTLRIIDKRGCVNGEWFCKPNDEAKLAYVKKVYREHVTNEPLSGWRLQTRGTNLDWHDWRE